MTLNVTRRRGLNINNKGGGRHTFDNEHAEQWNQISSWAHNDVNTGREREKEGEGRKRSCTSFYRWYINNPRTLPSIPTEQSPETLQSDSYSSPRDPESSWLGNIFTAHPPLNPSSAIQLSSRPSSNIPFLHSWLTKPNGVCLELLVRFPASSGPKPSVKSSSEIYESKLIMKLIIRICHRRRSSPAVLFVLYFMPAPPLTFYFPDTTTGCVRTGMNELEGVRAVTRSCCCHRSNNPRSCCCYNDDVDS